MPTPPKQLVTFIYVEDIEASSKFYQDILGLNLALDQGGCRIYQITPSAFIGICTGKKVTDRNGVILTLVSDDLENWSIHLQKQGVRIEKKPTYNEKYDITHLFCRDPDGYLVEIQVFHDPNWPSASLP